MKLFKHVKQWNEMWKQVEASKTKDEKVKQLNLFIMLFSSGIVALVLLAVLLVINAPPLYQLFLPLSVLVPFGGYSVMKINRLDLAALKRYKATKKNVLDEYNLNVKITAGDITEGMSNKDAYNEFKKEYNEKIINN